MKRLQALANKESIRRSDILVLSRKRNSGLIIDSTIQFVNFEEQPKLDNGEKQKIYDKTKYYLSEKFRIL